MTSKIASKTEPSYQNRQAETHCVRSYDLILYTERMCYIYMQFPTPVSHFWPFNCVESFRLPSYQVMFLNKLHIIMEKQVCRAPLLDLHKALLVVTTSTCSCHQVSLQLFSDINLPSQHMILSCSPSSALQSREFHVQALCLEVDWLFQGRYYSLFSVRAKGLRELFKFAERPFECIAGPIHAWTRKWQFFNASGQFGTRLQGGKDAASARYIFTRMEKITRTIFHEADDKLLDYLNEEGQSIEPQWYLHLLT